MGLRRVRLTIEIVGPVMAILQVLVGETAGERLNVLGPQAILGRHPDCHLVLDSGAVSRQHCANYRR